jgi:hypothetical protein
MRPALCLHISFAHIRTDALAIPGKGEHMFLGIPKEEVKQTHPTIPFKKKADTAWRSRPGVCS